MNTKCKLSKFCSCGSQHGLIFPSGNDTHAGKIKCAECGKILKWISKSEFDRATKLGLVNTLMQ